MSILKIARMGHPVLLEKAQEVSLVVDPDIRRLIGDMVDTLDDAGGVGLAAPQVHVPRRVIIFFVPEHRAAAEGGAVEAVPLTALINPEFEPITDDLVEGWEGCLSIPGMQGLIPRYRTIRYRGTAPDGSLVERDASGFHARVVQHEIDHLNGILYPMRMRDLSRLSFNEEWRRYQSEREEDEGA